MSWLSSGFLLLRLSLANTPFFLKLVWIHLPLSASLTAVVGLGLLHVSAMILATQQEKAWTLAVQDYLGELSVYESSVRQDEINVWLTRLSLQPTHRDTLVKLADLYCSDRQKESCKTYSYAAQQVDPNHPSVEALFQKHKQLLR